MRNVQAPNHYIKHKMAKHVFNLENQHKFPYCTKPDFTCAARLQSWSCTTSAAVAASLQSWSCTTSAAQAASLQSWSYTTSAAIASSLFVKLKLYYENSQLAKLSISHQPKRQKHKYTIDPCNFTGQLRMHKNKIYSILHSSSLIHIYMQHTSNQHKT